MRNDQLNDLWHEAFEKTRGTDESPLYVVARLIEQNTIERCAEAALRTRLVNWAHNATWIEVLDFAVKGIRALKSLRMNDELRTDWACENWRNYAKSLEREIERQRDIREALERKA